MRVFLFRSSASLGFPRESFRLHPPKHLLVCPLSHYLPPSPIFLRCPHFPVFPFSGRVVQCFPRSLNFPHCPPASPSLLVPSLDCHLALSLYACRSSIALLPHFRYCWP